MGTLEVVKRHSSTTREVNPMLRYRILAVIRILCTLIESEKDDQYCQ